MKKLLLAIAIMSIASCMRAEDRETRHGHHYHHDEWGFWRPHWCENGKCCHQHLISGHVSCHACDYCK